MERGRFEGSACLTSSAVCSWGRYQLGLTVYSGVEMLRPLATASGSGNGLRVVAPVNEKFYPRTLEDGFSMWGSDLLLHWQRGSDCSGRSQ